jgi:hypothetical protein
MKYLLLLAAFAAAQEQDHPGPDLGSGGVWLPRHVADVVPPKGDPPKSDFALGRDDPSARCLPPGVPRIMLEARPFEILQTANRVLILFEGGAHVWRQIWMDGRSHPKDPNPDWLGDSIGRWEGGTLVVDTIGFNDKSWLDDAGHRHSERLHVTEKFTRLSPQTMLYEAVIEDPGAYSRSWTVQSSFAFRPGGKLAEDICLDRIAR